MKAKKIFYQVCLVIFTLCMIAGVCVFKPDKAVVADTVTQTDVSQEVNMVFHSESNGVVEVNLTFGERKSVYPNGVTGAFWVNDNPSKGSVDLMKYIKIGDKTAREIVTANKTSNQYKGGSFPMTNGGVYAPIGVLVDSNGIIRIKVLTAYCAYQNLSITLLSDGFNWGVNDSTLGAYTMTLSKDVTFAYQNGNFSKVVPNVDVTDKAKMELLSNTNGVVEILLTFDGVTNVYPNGVTSAFWVNDNPSKGSVDLMQYIKIGDKTAREIVTANQTSNQYKGGSFPMTNGGVYAPIGVLVDGNGIIRIKVLTAYCAYEDLSITLLSGLRWTATAESESVAYTTSQDVTYSYANGYFYNEKNTVDVTDKIQLTIQKTDSNTPANDGKFTTIYLSFEGISQVLHKGANGSFWVNDNATKYSDGVDLMQYIYFNGNSARSIVSSNNVYTGLVLQSKAFGPVAVADYDGANILIYVRNDYINYSDLFITLKGGLAWETKEGKLLTTSSDETFCVKANSTVFENVEDALADDSFAMMEGASVRTSEYAGIRFSALYNEAELNYWLNNKGCTVEIGMLLTKGEQLAQGEELTFDTVNKVYIVCENNGEAKDGTYRFNGGVSPVKDVNSYTQAYVGRAYIKITVGNLTFYKYATVNDNVRTIAYVAQRALEDSETNLTAAEREFLQKIVNGEAVA